MFGVRIYHYRVGDFRSGYGLFRSTGFWVYYQGEGLRVESLPLRGNYQGVGFRVCHLEVNFRSTIKG